MSKTTNGPDTDSLQPLDSNISKIVERRNGVVDELLKDVKQSPTLASAYKQRLESSVDSMLED